MEYNDTDLLPTTYNIHGFNKAITKPKGEVIINMPLGEIEVKVTLCVVDVESPYNMIFGRPWLHGIKGVASSLHRCLRFPMPSGIGEIVGDSERSSTYYQLDVKNYEGIAKKRKDKWRKAKQSRKEEEFRVYMIRAKEGRGIPTKIPDEEGAPAREIKEPSSLNEPKANFVAADPTKEVNIGTEEEPRMVRIGT
ncbi:uncharacterized protein LOC113352252 [Papaver somniferum]|uniref:uncharacterized protein LOC113352252 n=1 Tax=Papaver somniferum TaxID=3469 RepID=UPI000E6FC806|nr:uncharacterized protein LOC113352252 [Papaver somniferum]